MTTQKFTESTDERRTVVRYTLGGILFGFAFPFSATLIDILLRGLPLSLQSALTVQASQPLHVIIDFAPLVLGAAGWLAGMRQSSAEALSAELRTQAEQRASELEKHMEQLQTVAEVGRFLTRAREMDAMLEEVLNQIVEGFDIYHAHIFMKDPSERFAELHASSRWKGAEPEVTARRREVGSATVLGQVTTRGEPLLALRTDSDPMLQQNEMVPAATSELVVPLRVGTRITGALDLQCENPDAFSPDDFSVYQTVADQLAVAIDNVRLFQEAQQNLREIEALNRQLTGEAWRDFLATRKADTPLGFRASATGTHSVDDDVQPEGATSLPIVVRGQHVGSLDVETPDDAELDEDVKAILEAVAERVALALDNTRLAQQAERTAQIQQLVGEFSRKLQAATDVRAILRLTASEASEILQTERGFVLLELQEAAFQQTSDTRPLRGRGEVDDE